MEHILCFLTHVQLPELDTSAMPTINLAVIPVLSWRILCARFLARAGKRAALLNELGVIVEAFVTVVLVYVGVLTWAELWLVKKNTYTARVQIQPLRIDTHIS